MVISRICGCCEQLGFSRISQLSITDTLWRAVDFHRSGRRGLSQKTAFIRRGLAEGKFSNYYPYILDSSIFNGQRATLRPNVIGDLEKAWEVSSSSAEEAEEEHESLEPESVAPKATWGGSSLGPKEPPFPPPPSRLRPAEPSHPPPKKVKLVPKEPSEPQTGRSHQEGSSSSSAEPTPLGVRSVTVGTTTKSSGAKQPPPFLAKGSAYRATILGSQKAKPRRLVSQNRWKLSSSLSDRGFSCQTRAFIILGLTVG